MRPGKEAAGEIEKQVEVVNNKRINSFALPGGSAFVHTGLIAAADNESQVAGVLASRSAGGGSRGPQFLSGHPTPRNRMKAIVAGLPARKKAQ